MLFCSAADAMLMVAGVAGLARLLGEQALLARLLTWGGAAFLLVYGLRALWRARRPSALHAAGGGALSRRAVLAQAAAFTLLNPHVYLDTVLLVGSVGSQQPETARPWFVAGTAAASVCWFSALGFGARALAPLFARPRAWQVLDVVVGATMLALAAALLRG